METSPGILIVGYGKHVQNKILPAIQELKIPILGIVSSNKTLPNKIKYFRTFEELEKEIIPSHVYIATKPERHLDLIEKASCLSKNLMVEKPIFVGGSKLISSTYWIKKDIVVKEAMMYKYNSLYNYLKKNTFIFSNFKKIEMKFILPVEAMFQNQSFRSLPGIDNSILYDIGCYMYDFLWSFKIPIEELKLHTVKKFEDGKIKLLCLKANRKSEEKNIVIKFGYGKKYYNEVNILSKYNIKYELNPFFYGRKGNVYLAMCNSNKKYKKIYYNNNCFVKMINDWFYFNKTSTQDELSNKDRISFIQQSLFKLSTNWRLHV
jgi:hypothetical protein